MAKERIAYFCTNCGTEHPKWEGQCRGCGEWNTLVEEVIRGSRKSGTSSGASTSSRDEKPIVLAEIKSSEEDRIKTSDNELNRTLGGGVVAGSVILMGGEPGVGKSTLLLQLVMNTNIKSLYVSGEESKNQIKMRAERMEGDGSNIYILSETTIERIETHIDSLKPDLVIIDSIQTMTTENIDSMPGTISQIRESAGVLQRIAKQKNIPIIIVGHITKDGSIAGPKLLEHIVDVVLKLEGDNLHIFRILRSLKNRFGATDEIGIYTMEAHGLREVLNPSELLMSQYREELPGNSIAAIMEGRRPILIETQALVSKAVYGTPQRVDTGYDAKRLSMLLAVLEKRCGLFMGTQDVFINIAGGIKVKDPAIDLALIAALISSYKNIAIPQKIAFAGEVGLSGEVRSINHSLRRISEAEKVGFDTFVTARSTIDSLPNDKRKIRLIGVKSVLDLLHLLENL